MLAKFKYSKWVIISVLLLGLLAIFYQWLKADTVAAYQVQNQDYAPSLLLSGEVISQTSTDVSSPVSAHVTSCPVQKGDEIKTGQLMLQLDDRQARIDRDLAVAAVENARAQLALAGTVTLEEARAKSIQADSEALQAQRQYERIQVLAQAGAVSQVDLEAAEQNMRVTQQKAKSAQVALEALQTSGANLEILQTLLQQRQAELAAQELAVEKCQITAPFDGLILDIYAQPGELVQAGSRVVLLSSGPQTRIRIQPDQRYTGLAALGNSARVWIPYNPSQAWPAQVVALDPAGNAEQGSLNAELSLGQQIPELYPGRLVSVQLFGALQKDSIIIDAAFLTTQAGQIGVWLARNNRAHFTPVQTGLKTPEGVIIVSGLSEGDLVLEPQGLREDQRVDPQIKR